MEVPTTEGSGIVFSNLATRLRILWFGVLDSLVWG